MDWLILVYSSTTSATKDIQLTSRAFTSGGHWNYSAMGCDALGVRRHYEHHRKPAAHWSIFPSHIQAIFIENPEVSCRLATATRDLKSVASFDRRQSDLIWCNKIASGSTRRVSSQVCGGLRSASKMSTGKKVACTCDKRRQVCCRLD